MKNLLLSVGVLLASTVMAAPLGDYQFKSPAFNGVGYSSHVLTIENQEATRRKAREDAIQAAIDKKIADDKNTNLAKFMNNLESRIYAQISQNVATAMFATPGSCTAGSSNDACKGNIVFQGNTITWSKVTDIMNCTGECILLRVLDPTQKATIPCGTVGAEGTCLWIPLSSFQMPGS